MTWIITHFEIVLVTLLATFAAILVLQQRRTPQSAAAWLMFIIAVPYLAFPAFVLLGIRKQRRRLTRITYPQDADTRGHAPINGLDATLRGFGLPGAEGGHRVDLLETPDAARGALMGLIRSARQSIDATFYSIVDDPVGEAFVRALEERVRAGVTVRLIVDRFGSLSRPRAALADFEAAGGQLRYSSPFVHGLQKGLLNLRNHRKMLVCDGTQVFSGGMNVGAAYMGAATGGERWVDLAYVLEGPAVATFRTVFASDWGERPPVTFSAAQGPGGCVAQLVPSGPDTTGDPLHDGLVQAIHEARNRVWLATPYFVPTEILGSALSIALRRGVDVRIMVPARSNQRVTDFARGAYLRDLHDSGARILLHPGMLHAKAAVIDDLASVGSANFDVRSMLLNFEVTLFLHDPATTHRLAGWYAAQEARCGRTVARAGLLRRVGEGFFRLGAPIL